MFHTWIVMQVRNLATQDVAISMTKSPSDQSIGTVDYLVIKVAIEEFSFIDDLPIETLKPIETFFYRNFPASHV
jgi:hypothetical protein